MNETRDNKQAVDIGKLQVDVEYVKGTVDTIMTNHLPHIYEEQKKQGERLAYWGGGIAILTFIAPIIINWLLK